MSDHLTLRSSRVRRWLAHLWREWTIESFRRIAPAFAKPNPAQWSDARVTAAWIGHATVLINFFGVKIVTDPVLFPRIGIRLPGFTIGPKRLTAPALTFRELPKIDIVLLSHAHFDHFDTRTLRRIARLNRGTGFSPRPLPAHRASPPACMPYGQEARLVGRLYEPEVQPVWCQTGSVHRQDADATAVITAPRTRDLLRWTRLRNITELQWGERKSIMTSAGSIDIIAVRVKHWGARMQRDDYRGYNGYIIEREGRRILFAGDTAYTDSFHELRNFGRIAGPGSAGQLLQSRSTATLEDATGRSWATQPVDSTGCPSGTKWVDLAIMSIGCYNPWIRSHCNPEQAVQMANDAGAQFIMPVHHQTFRLSFEPFREPIERFEAALHETPERIALREIGETFVLPL